MGEIFSLSGKKIWIAGHRGMVGSALLRRLAREKCDILTVDRAKLDLTRQAETESWIAAHRPDAILLAAARVGGILANDSYPAQFIHDNLAIQTNVIEGARRAGVAKLLYLGSSCVYPRLAPQPMTEDMLLTGPLEPTNEWYAAAKIAGLKMVQAYRRQYGCDFISAIPANLFGPGDDFDPETGHVVSALMARMHQAKLEDAPEIAIWGTGAPIRDFMDVDDCADALVFLLKNYSAEGFLNVGTGRGTSIAEIAQAIARAVGYGGKLVFDATKPDGMPKKLMDCSKLAALGWKSSTGLSESLARAYRAYLADIT